MFPSAHSVLHCHSTHDPSLTDDALVARAKVGPGDGSGQGGEEGDGTARLWRTVIIGDQEHRIDMQAIRPYLRVVTHGGQYILHPKVQELNSDNYKPQISVKSVTRFSKGKFIVAIFHWDTNLFLSTVLKLHYIMCQGQGVARLRSG